MDSSKKVEKTDFVRSEVVEEEVEIALAVRVALRLVGEDGENGACRYQASARAKLQKSRRRTSSEDYVRPPVMQLRVLLNSSTSLQGSPTGGAASTNFFHPLSSTISKRPPSFKTLQALPSFPPKTSIHEALVLHLRRAGARSDPIALEVHEVRELGRFGVGVAGEKGGGLVVGDEEEEGWEGEVGQQRLDEEWDVFATRRQECEGERRIRIEVAHAAARESEHGHQPKLE